MPHARTLIRTVPAPGLGDGPFNDFKGPVRARDLHHTHRRHEIPPESNSVLHQAVGATPAKAPGTWVYTSARQDPPATQRSGTAANRALSPSAIVGCARMASRK